MIFSKGDKIICIDDSGQKQLVLGQMYVIDSVHACANCQEQILDIGLKAKDPKKIYHCDQCDAYSSAVDENVHYVYASRFVKPSMLLDDCQWKKDAPSHAEMDPEAMEKAEKQFAEEVKKFDKRWKRIKEAQNKIESVTENDRQIHLAMNDFLAQVYEVVSIAKVEYWLLKYADLNKHTVIMHPVLYGQAKYNLTNRWVPYLKEKTRSSNFLNLFSDLEVISTHHRKEPYFKKIVQAFEEARSSKKDMKSWIDQYREEGEKTYLLFAPEYLDHTLSEGNLFIQQSFMSDLLLIDKADFQYTLAFIQIYMDYC